MSKEDKEKRRQERRERREKRRKRRKNRRAYQQRKRLELLKKYDKPIGEMTDKEYKEAMDVLEKWAERRYHPHKKRRTRKDKGKKRGPRKNYENVKSLRQKAKAQGLRGYSKMKREELLRQLAALGFQALTGLG